MSFWTDLRYRLEYGLLRLIVGLVRLIPLDQAVRISAWAWRKLAPRGRRHARALANLEKAFPEKSPEERERIALAMWENLGRVMAETMQLDRILAQPERIEIANEALLERYRGRLGPAVCVSLHMGNWELAMWPLVKIGANPAAIYRLVNNPYVDAYLRSQRKAMYPGGLFARGKKGGKAAGHLTARLLGNYLRQGGRVGLLADLYDRNGVEVPFFGHPARSSRVPALLARRLGCRVWIGRCLRVGTQSRFRVEMKELRVPRSDDAEADIRELTAEIQKTFEDWIREYPEQWMWSNRKFG